MRRREDHAITKHTLNLYAGDYAKLQALYPSKIGAAKIVRDIVRAYLKNIETNAAQRVDLVSDIDVELEAP